MGSCWLGSSGQLMPSGLGPVGTWLYTDLMWRWQASPEKPQRQGDLSGTRFEAIPEEPQQDERKFIMSQRSGRSWCRGKRGWSIRKVCDVTRSPCCPMEREN